MSQLTPEERARCEAAMDMDAARAALEKVFDAFTITARFEDMDMRSAVLTDWHGSVTEVVGLTQIQLWRFQERERNNIESDESHLD